MCVKKKKYNVKQKSFLINFKMGFFETGNMYGGCAGCHGTIIQQK